MGKVPSFGLCRLASEIPGTAFCSLRFLCHIIERLFVAEVVLATFAGNLAVVDGMLRTMVVASQTVGTGSVVVPGGELLAAGFLGFQRDIARRTRLYTLPAMDAGTGVHGELLVRYHLAVEVRTDDMGEGPGKQAATNLMLIALVFHDEAGVFFEVGLGFLNLLTFAFGRIGVHEGQTDVTLRHGEGEGAVQGQADTMQLLVEDFHGSSCAVATCDKGETEVGVKGEGSLELQAADELPHDMRRLPSVHGKAEADELMGSQRIGAVTFKFIGNEIKRLAGCCCQMLGCPSGVACS